MAIILDIAETNMSIIIDTLPIRHTGYNILGRAEEEAVKEREKMFLHGKKDILGLSIRLNDDLRKDGKSSKSKIAGPHQQCLLQK